MKFEGKLLYKRDSVDFVIIHKGLMCVELSNELNNLLTETVTIKLTHNNNILFYEKGLFLRLKQEPNNPKSKIYNYCVNNHDLESLLHNLVDQKISIEIIPSFSSNNVFDDDII
jgi:hypothetical protein